MPPYPLSGDCKEDVRSWSQMMAVLASRLDWTGFNRTEREGDPEWLPAERVRVDIAGRKSLRDRARLPRHEAVRSSNRPTEPRRDPASWLDAQAHCWWNSGRLRVGRPGPFCGPSV